MHVFLKWSSLAPLCYDKTLVQRKWMGYISIYRLLSIPLNKAKAGTESRNCGYCCRLAFLGLFSIFPMLHRII